MKHSKAYSNMRNGKPLKSMDNYGLLKYFQAMTQEVARNVAQNLMSHNLKSIETFRSAVCGELLSSSITHTVIKSDLLSLDHLPHIMTPPHSN